MPKFSKLLDAFVFGLILWAMSTLGSCAPARTILKQADLNPPLNAPAKLSDLEASYKALEKAIYGPFTPPTVFQVKTSEILSTDWLRGKARVERRIYTVSHGQSPQDLEVIFVTPTNLRDAPLIISQNFSSNPAVISTDGHSAVTNEKINSGGLIGSVFTYFFGRYIVQPPFEDILDRGYGFVAMHPPDYVADRAKLGTTQLDDIFGQRQDRPGALSVWASLTTALAEQLKTENPTRNLFAYGHSRYGKTALLATANSQSLDAAVSHQSGTAGASLMRDKTGESLKDMIRNYKHWLVPSVENYAENPRSLPTDSHALLAYIAPRPILLGNARRDVWSDPEGAYQAAKWASQNTQQVFSATRLDEFIPEDDIVIWIRPGTHGIVKEDWPAFLDFLDAHFK